MTRATPRPPAPDSLESLGAGVCVRSPEGAVRFQNGACRGVCGDQVGRVCGAECARFCNEGEGNGDASNVHFARGERLHAGHCDLLVVGDTSGSLTVLRPLDARIEAHRRAFAAMGLTRRETDVAVLAVIGRSNREIMRETGLSKATVRTHLNRIHQKLPAGWLTRLRGT